MKPSRILPLPSGLIGTAEPVAFDYQAGHPFFPFLSFSQLALLVAMYLIVLGAFALTLPGKIMAFVAIGSLIGGLPSILESSPCRLCVRSPRPEAWADFTRAWAEASRYLPENGNPDIWIPNTPIWTRWPGDKLRLRITSDSLDVTGRRLMMRQLKRNYDRITERGHRWD